MGRVKIDHSEAGSHLFAWVSGSGDSSYTVELGWTGSSLVAECSCPYFETGKGMCKHVWAVILSIEEQNLFTGLVGEGSSKLPLCTFEEELFSPHSLEGDEDLTEEFFDGEDQEYQGRRERSIPVSEPGSDWTASIEKIDRYMQGTFIRLAEKEANARQLTYAISVQDCLSRNGLFVSILTQKRKQNGEWSVGKSQKISQAFLSGLVHEDDIQIVSLVRGAAHDEFPYTGFDTGMDPYVKIDSSLFSTLFKKICQTGRASICREWTLPATGLVWEETPWEFTLELQPEEAGKKFFRVCGSFKRESEILPIEAPLLLLADGLLFWENRVAPLKDHGAFVWITELRRTHSLEIPSEQKEKFFSKLVNLPLSPPMDVPEELSMKTLFPEPKISVMIRSERGSSPSVQKERLFAELLFSYGGKKAFLSDEQRAFLLFEKKEILYRDFNEEKNAYDFLLLAGCRPPAQNRFWQIKKGMLEVPKGKFTVIVSKLLEKGWKVEAEGKAYKTSGNFDLSVRSGIDWFDISGQIDFEGYRATLPEILKAAKKGSKFITLDDGSFGMLPEK
ncbi:MAG: SNF2 helicase associated domain-containing protein, partial [Nitrospinota bacterium]